MDVMIHSSTFLLPTIPAEDRQSSSTFALVGLNQRLPRYTPLLWKHTQLRMCADGGPNCLYDEMPLLFPLEGAPDVRHRYKPGIIQGDMDSIQTEVPEFYISLLCILVAGALGGRFEHEAGSVNVVYRFSTMRIIFLSHDCLTHLLPRTHRHEIHIQSSVEGPHCGLIPIGTPSQSTTTGLQWDPS